MRTIRRYARSLKLWNEVLRNKSQTSFPQRFVTKVDENPAPNFVFLLMRTRNSTSSGLSLCSSLSTFNGDLRTRLGTDGMKFGKRTVPFWVPDTARFYIYPIRNYKYIAWNGTRFYPIHSHLLCVNRPLIQPTYYSKMVE